MVVLLAVGYGLLAVFGLLPWQHRAVPKPAGPPAWKSWHVGDRSAGVPSTDMAQLDAVHGQNWLNRRYQLVARCQDKVLDVYVDWHSVIGVGSPPAVTWQIGDQAAHTHRWVTSRDGTATFSNDPGALLAALQPGQTASFQVTDSSGKPHEAVFDLQDADRALSAIRRDCPPATRQGVIPR